MTQEELDDWLVKVPEPTKVEDVNLALVMDWGPVQYDCDTFAGYDVDLMVKGNEQVELSLLDTVPMSYGVQLGASIQGPVQTAPDSAFSGSAELRRSQIDSLVVRAINEAESGKLDEAILTLQSELQPRVDGAIGGDPSNDWVIDFEVQMQTIDGIDKFVEALEYASIGCN